MSGPVTDSVASPCNSVCRMDARTGLCEGCFRTIDEIIAWSTMGNGDKRALLEALAQRPFAPAAARKA